MLPDVLFMKHHWIKATLEMAQEISHPSGFISVVFRTLLEPH